MVWPDLRPRHSPLWGITCCVTIASILLTNRPAPDACIMLPPLIGAWTRLPE
jgi:hypothetical protein